LIIIIIQKTIKENYTNETKIDQPTEEKQQILTTIKPKFKEEKTKKVYDLKTNLGYKKIQKYIKVEPIKYIVGIPVYPISCLNREDSLIGFSLNEEYKKHKIIDKNKDKEI